MLRDYILSFTLVALLLLGYTAVVLMNYSPKRGNDLRTVSPPTIQMKSSSMASENPNP